MTEKTLFQKIAAGEIPGDFVHEDEFCFAIRDINPAAPVHVLIIPRKPIISIATLDESDASLIGHLFVVAKAIAIMEGLSNGYRLVFNTGSDGQQTVYHLHLHLLGGRKMTWPPG